MKRAPTLLQFVHGVYLPGHFLSDRTARQLCAVAERFEAWAGPLALPKITESKLTAFLKHLAGLKLEGRTLNNRRQELLTILRYAWKKRYIREIPRDVPRMPQPRRTPAAWTIEEVNRLLAVSARTAGMIGSCRASDWWVALELLLYWSGARPGDALAATPDDVDLRRALWRCNGHKTGKEHLYELHPSCVAAVERIYAPERPRLFYWPYSANHICVAFRRLVKAAGIRYDPRPCQLFYRLRRTNLTYCWAADPAIATRQADHSSPEITRLHYVDPTIARCRTAVDVLPVPRF
jgi:integrase